MPKFARWHYNLSTLIFVIVCAMVILGLTHALPASDISVSSMFCNHIATGPDDIRLSACAGFPAASIHALQMLRTVLFYVPPIIVAMLVLAIVRSGIFATVFWTAGMRHQGNAVVAYLVGPIIIVNLLLKNISGRPRPYESFSFGGKLVFVPAGDFSGACHGNCSFVSGEAAAAGWLLCVLPLLGGKHQRILKAFIIFVSGTTPALRVIMGGHFISDVILGWLAGAAAYPIVVLAAVATRQLFGNQSAPAP